jgi:arabinoxylan arabinofuranohydrolase
MNRQVFLLIFTSINCSVFSKNPIIPNKGANDPHIRIIDGKAYLSASHDKSAGNTKFIMEDWWLWSSDDLVNWKLEYTLKPEETYIGEPFEGCWATDFVKRNGKYYWYFSERNEQSDMISLAENPRMIEITNPYGPYNPDGKNTEKPTDDKPFLHFYNGKYYLSWGCFYAMADNVYGPYDYKGSIIEQESFAPGYDAPTWPNGFKQGRHGSFFEWHNQWYFAYCDISQTGNRYFRDTFISYVHYKENGEIALIRVDGIGVGEYDANQTIQAEDYFKAAGITKTENGKIGFEVADIDDNDFLIFNNIKGLKGKRKIEINATLQKNAQIEIHENTPDGKILATFNLGKKNMEQKSISFDFPSVQEKLNLCFVFKGKGNELLRFDSFSFY